MSECYVTRSSTDHFLIGQENPQLPNGMLPTGGDVLREIQWKRSQNKRIKMFDLLSCPIPDKNCDPNCSDNCAMKGDHNLRFTIWKIIEQYKKAGIPYIDTHRIRKKCNELYDFYRRRIKSKKLRITEAEIKAREDFKSKTLNRIFEVFHSNAEDIINADRRRNKKQKAEDIAFLHEQKLTHRAVFVFNENVYKKKDQEFQERKERSQKRKSKEAARARKERERKCNKGLVENDSDSREWHEREEGSMEEESMEEVSLSSVLHPLQKRKRQT